jgi:NADH-quinone oxidoreductase subunit M
MFLFSGGYLNDWGLKGAIIQMISHGFVSAAMFMCIGVMYDRCTRAILPITAVWST